MSSTSSPSTKKSIFSDNDDPHVVRLSKVIIYANVQRPHTLACIRAISAEAFASTNCARTTEVKIITPKDAISLLHGDAASFSAAAAASTDQTGHKEKTKEEQKEQQHRHVDPNDTSVDSNHSTSPAAVSSSPSLSVLPFLRLWEKENKDVLSKVQQDTPLLEQIEFFISESEREGHNKTLQNDAELNYAVFRRQMPTLCLVHGAPRGGDEQKQKKMNTMTTTATSENGGRRNRNSIEALLYRELHLQHSEDATDNTTETDERIKKELADRFFWFPKRMGTMAAVESNLFVRDVVPNEKGVLPNNSTSNPKNLQQQQHGEFYMKCVRSLLSLLHKHRNSKVVCVRGDGCPFFLKSCDGEDEGHVKTGEDKTNSKDGGEKPVRIKRYSPTSKTKELEQEFLLMPPTKFNTLLYQNIIDRMTTTTATTSSGPLKGESKKRSEKDAEKAAEKKKEDKKEEEEKEEEEEKDQATKDAEAIIENTLKSIQLLCKSPQLCGSFFPLNRYENRHVLRYMLLKGYTVIALDHFSSMARELAHAVSLRNFDTSLLTTGLLTADGAAGSPKRNPSGSPTSPGPGEAHEKDSSRSSSSGGTAVSTTARDRTASPPPPPPPLIHQESDNMKHYRQFCSTDNLSNLFFSVTNTSVFNSSLSSNNNTGSWTVGSGGANDPLRILAFYMNLKKEDVDLYIKCICLVQALERQWLRLPQPQHHLILQQPSHTGSGGSGVGSASMSNYLSPVMGSSSTRYHTSLSFSSVSSVGNAAGAAGGNGHPLSASPNWLHINPGLMLRQFTSLWLSSLLDVHDPKTGLVRLCEVALEDPQVVVLRHQRDAFALAAAAATAPLETSAVSGVLEAAGEQRSAAELDAIFDDWMLRVLKQGAQGKQREEKGL